MSNTERTAAGDARMRTALAGLLGEIASHLYNAQATLMAADDLPPSTSAALALIERAGQAADEAARLLGEVRHSDRWNPFTQHSEALQDALKASAAN